MAEKIIITKPRRHMSIRRTADRGSSSLDAFIASADPVAARQERDIKDSTNPKPAKTAQEKKQPKKNARIGRKPRSDTQGRMTKKATILFTDKEWGQLVKYAEDRPLGAFIRAKLKASGTIT